MSNAKLMRMIEQAVQNKLIAQQINQKVSKVGRKVAVKKEKTSRKKQTAFTAQVIAAQVKLAYEIAQSMKGSPEATKLLNACKGSKGTKEDFKRVTLKLYRLALAA